MPTSEAAPFFAARLEALRDDPDFAKHAAVLVALTSDNRDLAKGLVKQVMALCPRMLDKKSSTPDEKALARRCAKLIS